jgi:ribosome-associated protein
MTLWLDAAEGRVARGFAIMVAMAFPSHPIPESEIVERFVRASGPGGQNVNKVATAVELRFDVARSPSLNEAVRARLARLAGRRLTKDGVLVIQADRFRTQEQNRADARARLAELVRSALVAPKTRLKTRPSRAARAERLESKKRRAATKRRRGPARDWD